MIIDMLFDVIKNMCFLLAFYFISFPTSDSSKMIVSFDFLILMRI